MMNDIYIFHIYILIIHYIIELYISECGSRAPSSRAGSFPALQAKGGKAPTEIPSHLLVASFLRGDDTHN
jgi:hypothetical protein